MCYMSRSHELGKCNTRLLSDDALLSSFVSDLTAGPPCLC